MQELCFQRLPVKLKFRWLRWPTLRRPRYRQFRKIAGLKKGRPGVVPEYDKCIEIATHGALRELIPAGASSIIIITPMIEFIGGVEATGGYLAGDIVSGLLPSLF